MCGCADAWTFRHPCSRTRELRVCKAGHRRGHRAGSNPTEWLPAGTGSRLGMRVEMSRGREPLSE
eukprot:1139611-Prymnesium_polylepis.1